MQTPTIPEGYGLIVTVSAFLNAITLAITAWLVQRRKAKDRTDFRRHLQLLEALEDFCEEYKRSKRLRRVHRADGPQTTTRDTQQ